MRRRYFEISDMPWPGLRRPKSIRRSGARDRADSGVAGGWSAPYLCAAISLRHAMIRIACLTLLAAASLAAQAPTRKQVVEDLRLDSSAEDFPGIFRLRVGPRGQIAVFVSQDQSVRLFDSTGGKIASFGRRGAGPGESRAVNTMWFKADTFWHYDPGLKRLTFVTP